MKLLFVHENNNKINYLTVIDHKAKKQLCQLDNIILFKAKPGMRKGIKGYFGYSPEEYTKGLHEFIEEHDCRLTEIYKIGNDNLAIRLSNRKLYKYNVGIFYDDEELDDILNGFSFKDYCQERKEELEEEELDNEENEDWLAEWGEAP